MTIPKNMQSLQNGTRKYWSWLNIGLSVILTALGLWYLIRNVSLDAVGNALSHAGIGLVALAVLNVLSILVLKAWRWQVLFMTDATAPRLPALFWSMALGRYVNLILPFFRLGELVRVFALGHQHQDVRLARALGTLAVEKTLDLITLLLTLVLALPFIVFPAVLDNLALTLGTAAAIALLTLYLLAAQTEWVIRLSGTILTPLPDRFANWFERLITSGLQGLSSLRSKKLVFFLFLLSLLSGILSVMTPLLLFRAFDLSLGFVEAAVIHVAVSVALTPPSTPLKIGVTHATTAFMLDQFGVHNQASIVGYAIIYHAVTILPLIILGGISASRSKWQWSAFFARLQSATPSAQQEGTLY